MIRVAVALLLLTVPTFGQSAEEQAGRLILDASRALQAGSAPRFLGYFDRKQTPGFRELREGLTALLADSKVASSVETSAVAARAGEVDFEIDWLLQISSERQVGTLEQRRELVKATVRTDAAGEAQLIRIEPIAFFTPAPLRPAP